MCSNVTKNVRVSFGIFNYPDTGQAKQNTVMEMGIGCGKVKRTAHTFKVLFGSSGVICAKGIALLAEVLFKNFLAVVGTLIGFFTVLTPAGRAEF